jgi:hypothetical protein
MKRIRRVTAALSGLALTWLGLAAASPAAFASQVEPGGGGGPASPGGAAVTRTIVIGGMPGWQIALIAAAAALFAAGLAVLADRLRVAHRGSVPSAA